MSLVTTPAVLLRSFPYSETSTILKFYTRDMGVAGVMAKGARTRGSRGRDSMATFAQGQLTLYYKPSRELQTLKEFTTARPRKELARDVLRFAGASVLGELVLRHAGEEGNAPLFDRLARALDRLAGPEAGDVVRTFLTEGWGIVSALGYHPELAVCVNCGRPLEPGEMGRFDFASGGVRCADCGIDGAGPRVGGRAREQLAGLLDGSLSDPVLRPRAQARLLADFVTYHVADGRPLRSFGFLTDVLGQAHA